MELAEKKKLATHVGWLYLGGVAIMLLFIVVDTLLVNRGIELPTVVALLLNELFVIIPSVVYICVHKPSFKDDLGFRKLKVGSIFLSVLLGFMVLPICSFVNVLTQFFVANTMTQASGSLLADTSFLITFLLVGVYAPVCEELMFRALINREYNRMTSVLMAAVSSGILFGLIHMNINQACYAFVLGFIFALANHASGSVITSMIMHVVVNSFNMLLMFAANAVMELQGANLAEEAENTRTSGMLFSVAAVYFVLALVFGIVSFFCMRAMAEHEGRGEIFRGIFKKKNTSTDQESADNKSSIKDLISSPLVVAVVLCLVYTIYWQIRQ